MAVEQVGRRGVEQLLDGAVSFEQFLGERLHVAARNRIGQQKFDRLVIQEAVKAGAQKTFAQPLTVSVGMIFLRTGHSVAYPFAEEFEVFGSREHIDQFEAAEAEAALAEPDRVPRPGRRVAGDIDQLPERAAGQRLHRG